MSDSELQITFGGDASGAKDAAKDATAAVQSLEPAFEGVRKTLDAFKTAFELAFKKPKTDEAKKGADEIKQAADEIQNAAAQIAKAAEDIRQGIEKIGKGSGGAKKGSADVKKGTEDIKKEAGDVKKDASDSVSSLALLGGGFGVAASAALGAVKALGSWAQEMGKSGLETEHLSQKLGVGATTVQSYQAIAALMGTSVEDVAAKVKDGRIDVDQYNGVLSQYGIRNQEATDKGAALGHSLNESQVGIQGLNQIMTAALAPTFKAVVDDINKFIQALVQSYQQGGVVKGAMDVFAIALKVVVGAVDLIITALKIYYDRMVGVGQIVLDICQGAFEQFRLTVIDLTQKFELLGDVIRLVLTGQFDKISPTIDAWRAKSAALQREMVANAQQSNAKLESDKKQMYANMLADATAYVGRMKVLISDEGSTSAPSKVKPKPKAAHGGAHASKGQAAASSEEAPALGSDLPKATDWSAYIADANGAAAKVIQTIQDTVAGRQKATEEQIEGVKQAESQAVITEQQAHDQVNALTQAQQAFEIEAADKVRDAKIAATKAVLLVASKESADYDAALSQLVTAAQEAENAKTAAVNRGTAARAAYDARAAAADKQAADDYRARWDKAINPIVETFTQGLVKMAQGTQTFAGLMKSIGQQILNNFTKLAEDMLKKWLWKEVGQILASKLGIAQRQTAEEAGHAKSLATDGEATLKSVINSAVKAATKTYAYMMENPFTAPLAPVAAAAAFAGVTAFEGLIASAAGGWGEVPADGMMTELHKQEMVLPARLANPLRDMLTGYDDRRTAPSAAGAGRGGDTHNHTWTVSALDARNLETYLRRNSDVLARVLTEKVRMGAAVPA
ncbi:MAG: hypothetical protein P4L64_11105 [Caulobacteraceae bacterium]|nr:hypothetical protein [Caulobacteraceae bacterium]